MYTIENVVDKVVITMKSAKFYSERRHSKTHGGLANFSSLAYDCVWIGVGERGWEERMGGVKEFAWPAIQQVDISCRHLFKCWMREKIVSYSSRKGYKAYI